MILTSGTQVLRGTAINHDPEPWITEDGKRQNTSVVPYVFGARTYADYDPRPEFEVKDNPILSDIRWYRMERLTMNNPKGWDHVLRKFEQAVGASGPFADAPEEYVEHARKVITHLAKLEDSKRTS